MTGRPARPPPPGPPLIHVGTWSRLLSDYVCVMCHAMFTILAWAGRDRAGDCAGWIEPVPPHAGLDYPPDPHRPDNEKEFPW